MTEPLLAQLQRAGALRAIDVEFAQLLAHLDPNGDDALALAAAAVSQAVAQGHSCLPLPALGEVLASQASEPLRGALPELADLRAALAASTLVGALDDPRNTPLVFDGGERLWLRRYADYEGRVASGLLARARSLRPLADPAGVRARLARWFPGHRGHQLAGGRGGARPARAARDRQRRSRHRQDHQRVVAAGRVARKRRSGKASRCRASASPRRPARPRRGFGESIRERKAGIDCSDRVRAAIREEDTATIHRLLGYRPRVGFRHDRDESGCRRHRGHRRGLDGRPAADGAPARRPARGRRADPARRRRPARLGRGRSRTRFDRRRRRRSQPLFRRCRRRPARDAPASSVPRSDGPRAALADAFVELQHSHRFGADSGIGRLARAIRAGDTDAALAILRGDAVDVDLARRRSQRNSRAPAARRWVARLSCDRRRGLRRRTPSWSLRVFDVLTALREGPFGSVALNRAVEDALGGNAAAGITAAW